MTDVTAPVTSQHQQGRRALTVDERSMRVLELGLAGLSIVAVVLLAVVR